MLDAGLSRRRLLTVGVAMAAGYVSAGCGRASGNDRILEPPLSRTDKGLAPANLPLAHGGLNPDAVAAQYAGKKPQQWGTDIPGILTDFDAAGKRFALTFDACGGPGNNDVDENLLSLLIAQQLPATLFVNKRWIDANQARAAQLAANPLFELANHGTAHRPLSVNGRAAYEIKGTASAQEAVDEVWGNHERLTRLVGRAPRFFRTGTAHYDEFAVAIVKDLGETPVGYSLNADYGATSTAAQVQANMMTAKPGGISLAHMHRPRSGTAPGMYAALTALKANGFQFVNLP
ncbi:polysaccharide deacetylase family protein [Nocardia sp. NBC_01503]|uniref:polysaccharide deacetylase family protein n=1 Tax=Nocardia sp. NBC_01503 TaxID=2975997 RepID=UPI002E7C16AE|nr:polysaccharide deacetylase family protein [Nocardia sp. NBC_01503]WTL34122.1 polysaccharide deacetylase family protein [Nocardia sp. NBC_01503]